MIRNEKILRKPEVTITTGLPPSTLYRLIKQGDFPKQIKLSERNSGWLESEVQQWMVDRAIASRPVIDGGKK